MFLTDRSSPLLLTLIVEKRDIGHGRRERRGGGVGRRCREMGPNFSMIFDLFFICNEAARQEKVDSASKCFPVSSLDEDLWKSVFH